VGTHGLVLVVEDEPRIADLQRMYLAREGFGVHVETDGAAALDAARRLRPVAIVLDAGLPALDGFELLKTLRAEDDWTPVLLVTARDDEENRLRGLGLGADDYVTKPFSPRELVARLHAVLRRGAPPSSPRTVTVGPLRLDAAAHLVSVDDQHVALTPTEYALLAHLVQRPGEAVSRDELLSRVWGYTAAGGTRTVDVHVAQLRAKLGAAADLLRTVRGHGYRFDRPEGVA
jgi:DNA-binding response OmpR family regulator